MGRLTKYLFVHFKAIPEPIGEQVYFGLSNDGYHWEATNNAQPILTSNVGEKGVRDCTISRTQDGHFVIIGTDLSFALNFKTKYHGSWNEISHKGSKNLVAWYSDDLVNWSNPSVLHIGNQDFGCVWAPDVIYDPIQSKYVIHWSSKTASDNFAKQRIYYAKTTDFKIFSEPEVLYEKADSGVIDSAMYENEHIFYLFVKSEADPETIILLKSDSATGPFTRITNFDPYMAQLEQGQYEAPTAFKNKDGKWCLFLDYYGPTLEPGYKPFIASSLEKANFEMATEVFEFPYNFKHGTVLLISDDEYERIKQNYPNC